jgi:uncharacterized protein YndB with AHSA1/START domain
MTDDETPRIEITVAAPVDEVWDALRTKDTIRHWHGWDYEGLDAEIDLIFFQHVTEDAEARTLDVQGGDLFRLEPDGEGTKVTLTRAPRGVNPDWDAYYDEITEGWITFLHQLKFALERQPGAVRRTLFFSGHNPDSRSVVDELNLPEHAAGTPFEATLLGQQARGEVWFRSDHQCGVTVDAWGGGLLVVSSVDPTEARPKGAAMAVLSTYGLGDAELDELNQRWAPWWSGRYPAEEPVS